MPELTARDIEPTRDRDNLLDKVSDLIAGKPEGKPDADTHPERTAEAETGFKNELETQPDTDGSDAEQEPEKEIDTWAELAEATGKSSKELYDVKIPLAWDLGDMTVGDVKDRVQEAGKIKRREHEIEERATKKENEIMQANQEFNTLLGLIGKVPPELVAEVKEQRRQKLNIETRLMLDAMPEWQNTKAQEADMELIENLLQPYGLKSAAGFVDDHRIMKFLRDMARQNKRVQGAIDAKPKDKLPRSRKPSGRKRPAGSLKPKLAAAKDSKDNMVKADAVAELLRRR